jgi:hypothetical protein
MTPEMLVLSGAGLLSVISVVLGFIALLTQKKYIDKATHEVTEIEVKGFGKMKTNIPALAFVFLGFALAFYVVFSALGGGHRSAQEETWLIKGQFRSADSNRVWLARNLSLEQSPIIPTMTPETGEFTLEVPIPGERNFEDKYEYIAYNDGKWSAQISTKNALKDYEQGSRTNLIDKGPKSRKYAPVYLSDMSQ